MRLPCTGPLEVVNAEGFDVGLQDFKDSMQKLNGYFNPKSGELSDSDLERVAGGKMQGKFRDMRTDQDVWGPHNPDTAPAAAAAS